MPTTPKPKLKAAPTGSRNPRTAAGSVGQEKASGSSPLTGSVKRTPKVDTLRTKVARFYMMIGTVLVPFGRFIPQLDPIGTNLKKFSEEAADAWIDLAEEDPRVKSYLESLTGASTWGNVIGIHFAIFMGAMPQHTVEKVVEQVVPQEAMDDPIQFARSQGLSDEEIDQAIKMAEGIMSDKPKEPDIREVRKTETEIMKEEIKNLKKSGIVSPDELGVQNDGQQQYSGPQNTGGIK